MGQWLIGGKIRFRGAELGFGWQARWLKTGHGLLVMGWPDVPRWEVEGPHTIVP